MARVGIWLGLFLFACGGSAPDAKSADSTETTTTHDDVAPAASSDDGASSKSSGDAKTGDAKSGDTKSDDAKSDDAAGKPSSGDELQTVMQLVIEDAELDKYLRLTEPGRFPLKMAGKVLPSGIALTKAGQPVKIVDGEPAKKDAVLVITNIEIKPPEATVGYRFDIEGVVGTAHLKKASYGWELQSSRIVEHYQRSSSP
jgi:hypothetical protein